MLLVDRHVAAGTVREDFQRLGSEGVLQVGFETMKEIKSRIQEGIIQQDLEDLDRDPYTRSAFMSVLRWHPWRCTTCGIRLYLRRKTDDAPKLASCIVAHR
jgi:hypothetical protein